MKLKRILALLLCLCLVLPLFGCGKQVGNYKIVRTLGEESYCIGYRVGDQIALYVDAALRKLTADGTVHNLAIQWLGADNTAMEADENALESLESRQDPAPHADRRRERELLSPELLRRRGLRGL